MKVVIATPLYPPDIAEPAPYVKELARRLSKEHEVHILAYGYLPEQVPGVRITVASKRLPLPLRLVVFTFMLWHAARTADIVYAENGPSVALPAGIVARLTNTPFVAHLGDAAAHAYAGRHGAYGQVEYFFLSATKHTVSDIPLEKPEVLPFGLPSAPSKEAYEASWRTHLAMLASVFTHA